MNDYHSTLVTFSFNGNSYTQSYTPAIRTPGYWVAGMKSYYTTNSFPNITTKNNIFTYSVVGIAGPWKTITIPTGVYGLLDLNTYIQGAITANGDIGANISLNYNISNLGSTMSITAPYAVDYTVPNSLNTVVGFSAQIYGPGNYTSQNIMEITNNTDIYVWMDCVVYNNSRVNGNYASLIGTIPINVPPGVILSNTISVPTYVKLNGNREISQITVTLRDKNGNLLNNSNEIFTMTVEFRDDTSFYRDRVSLGY